MAQNFFLEGRLKQLKDIQRDYLFELLIPDAAIVTGGVSTVEDLIVRCRSAVLPGRVLETVESDFMGMKQRFPMKNTFTGDLSVEFEETDDQKVRKSITNWMNKINTVDLNSPLAGVSTVATKREIAKDIYLLMYKYNGAPIEKKVRFINAYPVNLGDVTLSYAASTAVKYTVGFKYDFYVDE